MTIVYLVTIFILGTVLGSATSVFIYRLHAGKNAFKGRSMCPACEAPLKAKDLVPIFSFLLLRGKCRYCGKEISWMYPFLELLFGILLVIFFLKYPFVDEFLNFDGGNLAHFLLYTFYTGVLLFTFFFDLHYLKVADEILLPAILIGLIATISPRPETPDFYHALVGMLIAASFFGIQYFISRGKWMGEGDIRVGAFMGVILGYPLIIVALVLSYLVGSIGSIFVAVKKHQFHGLKVPFAPFLVIGTFLTIFYGQQILDWYLRTLML